MKKYRTIYVNREKRCTDSGMLGHILVPEKRADEKWILRKFSTLELPWKNNAKRISAVPDGKYTLIKRRAGRRFYEKYKSRFGHDYVCEVSGVSDRSAVLIHIGNWVRDSRGCLLLGYPAKNRGEGQEKMIENSTQAYKIFYELTEKLFAMNGDSLEIIITTMGEDKCIYECAGSPDTISGHSQ